METHEPTTDGATDIDRRLGDRVKSLRAATGLSLERLATRAGVSRSMISLIERGESSPTARVLDRIAAAFGLSLAALFEGPERRAASPVSRRAEQPLWRDPETGYLRRPLTPAGLEPPFHVTEIILPAGTRVACDAREDGPLAQQIVVLDGKLGIERASGHLELSTGDCLSHTVREAIAFVSGTGARYLVVTESASGATAARPVPTGRLP